MEKGWHKQLTDTDMHIVPGIDDGAATMEEALEMVEAAVAQGVNTILVTPHSEAFDRDADMVKRGFEKLKKAVADKGLPVFLYPGCEVLCSEFTVDKCIRKLRSGRYPTLSETDHILLEFDPEADSADEVIYCIDELMEAGYKPILAHVERYRFTDVLSVTDLRDRGAKIQICAFSVQNEANAHIRNTANDLLAKQLVDYVGTDAHGMEQRPPMIWEGARVIESTYGEVYARRILVENTRRLILEKWG